MSADHSTTIAPETCQEAHGAAIDATMKPSPCLLIDGRSQVIAEQRKAEGQAVSRTAGKRTTSPERMARLLELLREIPDNDLESQLHRTEQALRGGPATTHELRRYLDVMHPGNIVMTMRRRGFDVLTTRVIQDSERGKPHRIGEYVLLRTVGAP